MSSKEAPQRRFIDQIRSHRLASSAAGIGLIAVAFLVGRWMNGPSSASAQVPRASSVKTPVRTVAPAGGVQPSTAVRGAPGTAAPAGVRPAAALAPAQRTATASAVPAQARTAAAGVTSKPAVAVVNGETIPPDQLANECLRRFGKEVLESIINKQLIWQECQKQSVKITEQDVEDEVERMAAKFGLSTQRWLTMLQQERDINPDQYRREIIWPTLALRRLAAATTQVSDEELRKAFESEYGPQVRVRMIALLDAQTAEKVHAEAVATPEKFPDLAKQYSRDPNSAASRGIIPPIRKHLGEPELERVAFSLKKGEVSPVIHVANQFLILKCEQHIQESYVSSQDLPRVEQRLHDQIRDNKLRAAAAEMFQRLQNESKVVNVFGDAQLAQQMPGVAATINGGQITIKQLSDECLSRHGKDVLEGEINRKLLEQELQRQKKQVTQASIDEEITRAADSFAFHRADGTPDVQAWLKSVTETENLSVDLYVRDMVWPSVALKTIVGDRVQVTKEDLDKGFRSNYGERVEVLAIVLANQRDANKVWEMARNNATDQFFAELAQQYSVEPVSRANGGKVPPIREFGGQPLVEQEAFRLKPGELSGIVGIGDKYIIMRCLGRTQPVQVQFADVEEELVKDIREKKLRLAMAEEFDRLRETAQIDNFLANTTQSGRAATVARQPAPAGPARR